MERRRGEPILSMTLVWSSNTGWIEGNVPISRGEFNFLLIIFAVHKGDVRDIWTFIKRPVNLPSEKIKSPVFPFEFLCGLLRTPL